MRGQFVVEAVAREESDGGRLAGGGGGVVEDGDGRGGGAPGGGGVEACDGREVCEGLEAGAAYDGDTDGVWRGLELRVSGRISVFVSCVVTKMLEEERGRAQGLGEETGFSSPLYLFGRSVIFLLRPDRDIGRLSARMDLVERLRMHPIPSIGGNRTRTGQVPNVMAHGH